MPSASKPRLRTSIPTAAGRIRPLGPPRTKSCNKSVGRLSTTSQPMSSSASSTVDLPAPDIPVTSRSLGGDGRRDTALGLELQTEPVEPERDLGRRRRSQPVNRDERQADAEDRPLAAIVG